MRLPAFDHVPDAVLVASADNRIRYANPAVGALLGWEPTDLIGLQLTSVIPPRLRPMHEAGFAHFAETGTMRHAGVPLRVAALHREGHEIVIDLVLAPIPGPDDAPDAAAGPWAIGMLRDVGDRLALEREILIGRYLRACIDVTTTLQKAADPDDAFAALLPTLCGNLDWEIAAMWRPDADGGRLRCVTSWHDGELARAASEMTTDITLRPGEGLPGEVWMRGEPVVYTAPDAPASFPRFPVREQHRLVTGLGFPLLGSAGPLGVLEFWSQREHLIDDDLHDALLTIGRHLGLFLERVDAQAQVRHTLEVLQTSLLPPRLPAVPGVELAAHYRSASGEVAVGGDFYDVFAMPDGRWLAVIADVCGKGAAAAAVTAMARYTIRTAAMEHDDPGEILAILNQALVDDPAERPFLTACLALLDARGPLADVTVVAAGHPLPLLRQAGGKVRPTGHPGDLLGVLAHPRFEPVRFRADPGDTLLMYTDGFTEARDPDDVQFGETGLAAALAATPAGGADVTVRHLVDALAQHSGSRATRDDATALVVRFAG